MRRPITALLMAVVPSLLTAQVRPDSAFLAQLRWRSIGPANMTGRVVDIEGNPRNPKEVFVAFATGGIWKTVNAGTTWTQVFDRTGVFATGEIAIAPSDTSTIYVGTGEVNSRNSMSPGTGIFKSTNGGRTWTFMGLRETQVIGRIIVHPTDPNTVWVCALGHPWGPNRERGIYKTTDGGSTWRLVQFVSDKAGFVDMAIDPSNPNTLYAASWERQRGPYYLQSGGPGSGLWKTTDGGEHWTRLSNGLPTTTLGRIGLAVAPSNGNTVYALVEADSAANPESVRAARQRGFMPDTTRRARLESGLFRSTDGGQTFTRMTNEDNRPFYYSQLRVDPRNADRVYWLQTAFRFSNDGGRTWRNVGQGIHTDYHALWIDPNDPDHYVVGEDGGVAQTFDRGRTYDAILQMAVGQFYAVNYDMQRPFWVCGGIQDNGSWCGPTESINGRITNNDWWNVGGGDGFYAAIDPTNPNIIYSESQGGSISRLDARTWERRSIRPGQLPTEPGAGGFGGGRSMARVLEDSVILVRGDTAQPVTPAQQHTLDSLQARIVQDTGVLTQNRFNWQAPFQISPHNATTLYMGGHRVYKTVDRGEHWTPISEDLSTRDTAKIRRSMATTGGITLDASNAETHGTVTTLAESSVRPGLLFAGTDDGNVWMTRNDGANWENLTTRFPGQPRTEWVTRVTPSPFDSATVYVTFDGHRNDDFHPHVYKSTDFGRTFRSISTGIPDSEYVHVITEDPRRRGLLFLGSEVTAYVSTDTGATWQKLNAALPPVPVHDLKVHSRDRTLIAATHGRSIWVLDIGPLEQATDSLLSAPVALFAPEVALMFNTRAGGGGVGARGLKLFSVPNSPPGVRIPIRINGDFTQVARGPGAGGAPGAAGAEGGEGGEGAAAGGGGGGGGGGFGGGGLLALIQGNGGARPAGDSVMVVITDVSGDTVRTLYTNARPTPLRWISWDMRRNRGPLDPVSKRDSIRTAARVAVLRDSLRTAGLLPPPGQGGGGRGGAARDPEPGEPGTPITALQLAVNPPQQSLARGGGGGGGGGFGGGAGPLVEPGMYLVTVRINGRDYHQAVRIERPSQPGALPGGWR